jgi:DNA-binding beta-propeller fold protein YncE
MRIVVMRTNPGIWGAILFLVTVLAMATYAMPVWAGTVVTSIPVCGQDPAVISINPQSNIIYAFGQGDGTIINGATNTVITCVPAIGTYSNVDVNPNTNRYYVAHQQAGSVTVRAGTSPAIVATIVVPGFPSGVAVNSATNRIYVSSQGFGGNDRVFVIDGMTNTLIGPLGGIPTGGVAGLILVNPITNLVYVGTSNGIAIIDGFSNTMLGTIPGFLSGGSAVLDVATNLLYAREDSDGQVAVIDGWTNNIVGTLSLFTAGTQTVPIAVHQAMNRIYVGTDANELLVASGTTATQLDSLTVGPNPIGGAAVNPRTNLVYVPSRSAPPAVTVVSDDVTICP